MKELSIQKVLSSFQYEKDLRKPPDNRRRAQFRVGWEDATLRDRIYTTRTLRRLTWRNLGYRFGKVHGYQLAERIDRIFYELGRDFTKNK